ncbi:TPA: cation:proton antiporter [Streptococcus agalactiae]|nr:cation:proton antiporter [Streptococcus agalactiae]HEO0926051.1 cation:proton antiporter [Streptococcus agalactiae]HEO8672990.1 cation:proton antiporter [Streptococcus agalactiae]
MHIIIQITIILLASVLATLISKRIGIPAVVGQLLVGIIIGPAMLGLVHQNQVLHVLSEIGVILLMFLAGLEANFDLLKKYLKPSLLVAITGVIVPMALFYFLTRLFGFQINTAIFYGLVFAATSISITVEVLQEYNRVKTDTGAIILGAAVADDVLAVLLLSVFIATNGSSSNIGLQIIIQLLFFVFLFICMKYLVPALFKLIEKVHFFEKYTILAILICFSLSILADKVGMSSIIGSFFAGLAIGQTSFVDKVEHKISLLSYTFFIPIFFASIALPLKFDGMMSHLHTILIFTALAVLSKLIPGYFVGRDFNFSKLESLTIGGGMVSRGEMALIIVQVGLAAKIISSTTYSELVIVVILSTIIAPFILKYSFKD